MNTLFVIGAQDRLNALAALPFFQALATEQKIAVAARDALPPQVNAESILLDLNLDERPATFYTALFKEQNLRAVIGCAVKKSLAEMSAAAGIKPAFPLAGVNALPSFIERNEWEVSALSAESLTEVAPFFVEWGVKIRQVEDRVGMVAPRILVMIINEAFFTVEEGAANEPDIDAAMKLGVNYPHGPFEWLNKIGLTNVAEILLALERKHGDPKFRLCSALRHKYYLETVA